MSKKNNISNNSLFSISKILSVLFLLIFFANGGAQEIKNEWPILKHYDRNHINKIALPIGGIGTGTVSLGGRGNLQDWEIVNRPAKGFNPGPGRNHAPFFSIYTEYNGKKDLRLLEGPAPLYEYEGFSGNVKTANHGMPRFESATFDAAYPFGQVNLKNPDLPFSVRIKSFNPLIPGDAENSGIPIVVLKYEITNHSIHDMIVSVCGSLENFIGEDGSQTRQDWTGTKIPIGAKQNKNMFKQERDFKGIFMVSEGVDKSAEQWGTIALTTTEQDVSFRSNWKRQHWGTSVLDFWDDFSEDGVLEERPDIDENKPMASLAARVKLKPGQIREINFFITWHFPNRKAWASSMMKNYYTTHFDDAWDVIRKTLPVLNKLEQETIDFVTTFCESDLPDVVKEAALFNISTLRTQTCFRTADGNFYAWEGCNDNSGCCHGSCTHVWNYEQATGFLFAELAKKRREIEFGLATNEDGLMSFRVNLPKDNIRGFGRAAADGQMGAIMKMYRDWQLSGDTEFLKKLYPNVKKALQFCWIPGGWDADIDGVMEGTQHNTMDVEYYGPNPQMGIWYLGALRAVEEMSRFLGENDFADNCVALYVNGRKWLDENLFNGEYFFHEIRPPKSTDEIAPSLIVGMGGGDKFNPDYQLGEGCLVDQLVGQFMAHVCGLGYLVEPSHVKTTLNSIMKFNYREKLRNHFNCFRTFALGDESALLMASYPYKRPKNPFPYFTEVMTGFEYTAAVGMLYEGQLDNGLKCIKNIRDRYDGKKRSPFDEAECGHHYGRAMASWAAVLALSDFNYSAVTGNMRITSKNGTYFWSNGNSYGSAKVEGNSGTKKIRLKTRKGKLKLKSFTVKGFGKSEFKQKTINTGDEVNLLVSKNTLLVGTSKNLTGKETIQIIKPVKISTEGKKSARKVPFTESVTVILTSEAPATEIRYTLDGSIPDKNSSVYSEPLTLFESTELKALAFDENRSGMIATSANFHKIKQYNKFELTHQPSPKYPGHGDFTLVDGAWGSTNFADGNWLGFEKDDFILNIDFEKIIEINKVTIGFLEAIDSWIFLPLVVSFFTSNDGKNFELIGRLTKQEIEKMTCCNRIKAHIVFENVQAKYLRIEAENIGTCPPGHPGAGGGAWIFVDEVFIE
jgi:non-lysosomal glucosylceramidase